MKSNALDLVKTSVAPRIFKTGPPNYYTQTSFTKKLDVSANFVVDDSGLLASTGERIPTSTGLIVWQPNRGAGSMYRGTRIELSCVNNGGTVAVNPVCTQVFNCSLNIAARSVYGAGELGPARVIRWDGMSNGQQIKVDGVINCQCIPEGSIAPFVQQAAMYSDTAHNLNAITMLAELYNGDSPFRRNWTSESYDNFMRTIFPKLSGQTIAGWEQPKLIGTAASAGMFGTEARSAGEFGATGTMESAGEFGATGTMNSAGEFGATGTMNSAGEFGAKGKFGGKRKRGPAKRKAPKRGRPRLTEHALSSHSRSHSRASSVASSRKSGGRRKKQYRSAASYTSSHSRGSSKSSKSRASKHSRRSAGSRGSKRKGARTAFYRRTATTRRR